MFYSDPNELLFPPDDEEQEQPPVQWFDDVALSIDPERGAAYDYTVKMMKELAGVEESDADQNYTYFGLPAASASPNAFEDYEQ